MLKDVFQTTPVVLAPMSGVSDLPFRRLVGRLGVDVAVSEMIASAGLIKGNRQSRQRGEADRQGGPNVVQIAGCVPELMAGAARVAEDQGAEVIDINMGCPVKKVVSGYAGSALMRQEELALAIIEATVAATRLPVTLKMRTGWDMEQRNAPRLAALAVERGIRVITVHGRTRQQLFEGHADWDFIAEVKRAIGDVPLIANGDVREPEDAVDILKRSGADGVMIGRGSYGRPWRPGQIRHFLRTGERLPDPSIDEQRRIVQEHYDDMLSFYGTGPGVRIARKHLNWYVREIGVAEDERRALLAEEQPARVRALLDACYDRASERRAA